MSLLQKGSPKDMANLVILGKCNSVIYEICNQLMKHLKLHTL